MVDACVVVMTGGGVAGAGIGVGVTGAAVIVGGSESSCG